MKITSLRSLFSAALLLLGQALFAQSTQSPKPSATLDFELVPALSTYYVGQQVDCILRLNVENADIWDSQMSLGTPLLDDANYREAVSTSDFTIERAESSPTNNVFKTTLSLLKPADLPLSFELAFQVGVQIGQRGFYPMTQLIELRARSPEKTLVIREVPADAPQNYVGLVSDFAFRSNTNSSATDSASPQDLLTLQWEFTGPGAEKAFETLPSYNPGKAFRSYPPRVEARENGRLCVSQVYVPLELGSFTLPAFSLFTFSPEKQAFVEHKLPERTITIVPREEKPEAKDIEAVVSEKLLDGKSEARGGSEKPASDKPSLLSLLPRDQFYRVKAPTAGRIAPSLKALSSIEITPTMKFSICEQIDSWCRIRLSSGASAWILHADISIPDSL